ncbi:hypothetical protein FAM09_26020 [Niastella caeni]|uniref:Uncharacterized protein n=1 Tax=Niastella caeni TaxID=2569763 RepID=A0A4S8HD08_9BACT|nr:DUF6266 family protein [Niastella caeni]THU32910.1 hypothetical protein FAM09_26020 [Niastella caeni]
MLHAIINASSADLFNSTFEESNKDNPYYLFSKHLANNIRNLTTLQFAQQTMFVKLSEFVLSLFPFLVTSTRFVKRANDISFVMADIFKNGLSCTGPEFNIDYSKVLVSQGNLPGGILVHVKASLSTIHFTWEHYKCSRTGQGSDKAILVAYCEALNKCIYTTWGARRQDEEAILEVPQFHGHTVQTWLSFISADGKQISKSTYTGAVKLSDYTGALYVT